MCLSLKYLSKSKNGSLTFCSNSKLFQLIFNNLCFELYEWELEAFKEYLQQIDTNYWEQHFKNAVNTRKIPVPIGVKHFIVVMNKEELYEMKQLLNLEKNKFDFLKYNEIAYQYLKN